MKYLNALPYCALAVLVSATPSVNVFAANSADDIVEEVVVVGTRGQPRSVFDSAVPVDVISSDELESASSLGGEVGELLQNLSPSFNFPRQSNSGAADTIRTGALRGLNPDQTLVLVNGKRQHTSAVLQLEGAIGLGNAPFDFNTIPSGAIERIEILRDGASAQYGSDAIAGVINIVLKEGAGDGSVFSTYGAHVTDFEPQDRDITDGQTFYVGGDYGFDLGNDGFLRVGAEYRDRNGTRRGGLGQLPFFENQSPVNLATNDTVTFAPGDGDTEDFSLHYNAEFALGNARGYSFGRYNNRDSEGTGFFRYPDSSANVQAIFPNGFRPTTTGETDDLSLTFGVRGNAADWAWDISATYGSNEFDQGVTNSLNPSFGINSPRTFNVADYERDQLTINADVVRDYDIDGLAGPLTVAFGAEYRREDFETSAGDPASFQDGGQGGNVGVETGPGLTPESEADIDRRVYGVYGDISAAITDNLTLGAAVRFEDYDDFGNATTGKLSGLFRINDAIAIRAAVSNSFRAPAIVQIGFENSSQNFGAGGALVTIGQVSVNNPIAIANGAQELTEEESVNISAGIVITPNDRFALTLDVYQIDIDDRLSLQGAPAANITFFTNLVDTETEGVDLVATYDTELFGGNLGLSAAATYTDTDVSNSAAIGEEEINILETAAPDSKVILTADWEADSLDVLVRLTRFGETTRDFDFGGGFPDPQEYDAKWSTDIEVGYRISDQWKIVVGADNVFDEYADLSNGNINFFSNLPYDVLSPIGFNGRFVYARTKYTF